MDELMLSSVDYARSRGLSLRQVQRYLADGRLPGALKHGGAWMIPATSAPTSHDVVAVAAPTSYDGAGVVATSYDLSPPVPGRLGVDLLTLEEVADGLRTSVGAVRRMAADGLLEVRPYGPRGAHRVLVRSGR